MASFDFATLALRYAQDERVNEAVTRHRSS